MCAFALIGMNRGSAAEPQIDTIRALPIYLRSCWLPPMLTLGTVNSKITVLMSFKSSGELLGKPKVTFQSHGPLQDEIAIREAAALAVIRCTPLPITDTLGGAIAGRTFRMTFDIKTGHPI